MKTVEQGRIMQITLSLDSGLIRIQQDDHAIYLDEDYKEEFIKAMNDLK